MLESVDAGGSGEVEYNGFVSFSTQAAGTVSADHRLKQDQRALEDSSLSYISEAYLNLSFSAGSCSTTVKHVGEVGLVL